MPTPNSNEQRLAALELWRANVTVLLARVAPAALAALQVPPQSRAAGTAAAMSAGGKTTFDPGGLVNIASVLINGGTQTGGPIAGTNGPPFGIAGTGGEVVVCTGTFTLPRQETVLCIALCCDFATNAAGPFLNRDAMYIQIDGTTTPSEPNWGVIPVASAAVAPSSCTVIKIATLATGKHTVAIIWNPNHGNNETLFNVNNPLFVFQLGS